MLPERIALMPEQWEQLIDEQCLHRHYSGRRCQQPKRFFEAHCGLHAEPAACQECAAMLAVFPIRRQEKRDGEF